MRAAAASTGVKLSLRLPAHPAGLHAAYVSAATKSFTVAVDGTQAAEVDIVAGQSTYAVEVHVTSTTHTFAITLFDAGIVTVRSGAGLQSPYRNVT